MDLGEPFPAAFQFERTSPIDECPQRDMILVGPGHKMAWLVDRYESWQRKRFAVHQSIPGWLLITGCSDKPMHLNTDDDFCSGRNYSLWLDIQILLKTPFAVIRGGGRIYQQPDC